jgi:hypothetical protein
MPWWQGTHLTWTDALLPYYCSLILFLLRTYFSNTGWLLLIFEHNLKFSDRLHAFNFSLFSISYVTHIFTIHLYTKCQIPSSNGSVVIAINPEAKEIFRLATMLKRSVFCDIAPCKPLEISQRFGGPRRPHLHCSRTSQVISQYEAGRYILEDKSLQSLKRHKYHHVDTFILQNYYVNCTFYRIYRHHFRTVS